MADGTGQLQPDECFVRLSGEWDILEQMVVMAANPSYHPGLVHQLCADACWLIDCFGTADIGLRRAVYNSVVAERYRGFDILILPSTVRC